MIPHDVFQLPRFISDAATFLKAHLFAMGWRPGFKPKPDLGIYKEAGEVPQRAKAVPFNVPVRYRGRDSRGNPKRVDPVAERRRMSQVG